MNFFSNPYNFSKPMYTKKQFFDRHETISEIVRAMHTQQSVQLVGQWRIGKSSILRHLELFLPELMKSEKIIPIYYDLSRRPKLTNGTAFFALVWRLMSNALSVCGEIEAVLPPDTDLSDGLEFNSYLECWIKEREYKIIVLLDEFGLLASDKLFDATFFGHLRGYMEELTYIIAGTRTLSSYAHEEIVGSPFWNPLRLVHLGLFETRDMITDLIHKPMIETGISWSDNDEQFIYDHGGQHPCYIQLAAESLFNALDRNDKYLMAHKKFCVTAHDHFRLLWKSLSKNELFPGAELQEALVSVLHGRTVDLNLIEELQNNGLVWYNDTDERWEVFSNYFGDWINRSNSKNNESSSINKTPFTLAPNQRIANRYVIMEILPPTKHSQVVKALDERLDIVVAIKFILTTSALDNEITRRLQDNLVREAQILASLHHPNIGRVFNVLTEPLCVVMEWIEGVSLEHVLGDAPIQVEQVVDYGIVLAGALEHAHKRKVFHRDIKPSNVIVSEERGPVLIDFDVARAEARDTITLQNKYVGTPAYSAPEQFLNPEGVGSATDLFSLGVLLYQLATGNIPYELGNLPSLYGSNFPPLKAYDLPVQFHEIMCLLLQDSPTLRTESATILQSALSKLTYQ